MTRSTNLFLTLAVSLPVLFTSETSFHPEGTAALTTVERVHLDVARQRLVVDIDLLDPEFFKQPFPRGTLEYAPSALKIEPFNCSPEGVTGTLKR